MNTQMPITNVTSAKAAALPTSQAESLTPEVPFNKMLSQEVSNRNNMNSTSSAPVAKSEPQPQAKAPAQAQSKPAEASKDNAQEPAQASAAAAPAAASSSSGSSKTASADADSDKDVDQAKGHEDEDSDSTPASAQMLALVANVGQMNQTQQVGKKGAADDMDALANQKNGKKAIGHIGANAKQEHVDLKADGEAHDKGKEKGELFALGGLEAKQSLDKEPADGKPALPGRNALPGDKFQPEAGTSRNTLASGPDASALTHNSAKFALDPGKMKPAEATVQQQLPTAATVVPAMQQAMSLNQQAAVNGQAVERLTPPVGSQGWDQAVGQKVVWMASGGLQSASLTLNPPDLGPLQVVLHVNNDQADATFITAQPEVKQALEAAMPKLREMMDQAGIQLGQATVNTGMPNQQQGAGQQQAQSGGNSSRLGGGNGGNDEAELNVASVPVRRAPSIGGQGLVDTFA